MTTPSTDINPDEDVLRMTIAIIAYTRVLSVVICIGVIGNILNIIVLTRKNMKSMGYIYLRVLALSDCGALLLDITYAADLYARKPKTNTIAAFYGAHIEFPLKQSLNATSTLLVLTLTLERYIALCFPLKSKRLLTSRNIKLSVVVCLIFAIFFNIPRAFERTIVPKYNIVHNMTLYMDKSLSKFALTSYYNVHKILYTILFQFMPLTFLFILNLKIIVELKKLRKKRLENLNKDDKRANKRELGMTVMLIGIVIMFCILVVPGAIAYILASDDSLSVFIFTCCADVLGEMNFAVNFFIYCACSDQFRSTFQTWIRCGKTQVSIDNSATTTN